MKCTEELLFAAGKRQEREITPIMERTQCIYSFLHSRKISRGETFPLEQTSLIQRIVIVYIKTTTEGGKAFLQYGRFSSFFLYPLVDLLIKIVKSSSEILINVRDEMICSNSLFNERSRLVFDRKSLENVLRELIF